LRTRRRELGFCFGAVAWPPYQRGVFWRPRERNVRFHEGLLAEPNISYSVPARPRFFLGFQGIHGWIESSILYHSRRGVWGCSILSRSDSVRLDTNFVFYFLFFKETSPAAFF
jgi:hypothetical protein